MIALTIHREPVSPPALPPAALDAILATLARDGIRPTRTAILQAAIGDGHDPEFAAVLARRAEALDAFDAAPAGPL